MPIRFLRLTVVTLLAVALAGTVYIASQFATNPGPRDAAGWALLAPLPTARGETAAAVSEGRLYIIGGLTGLGMAASAEVSVYDPSSDSWETAPPIPQARHHAAAVGLDGTVYVSGGASSDGTAQATLWALPAGAEGWTELAPMPEGRNAHRLLAIDGSLYAVGGVGSSGHVLRYDVANGSWTILAEIPVSRDHLAAVVADGEIWAIGGRSGGENHARVDIYDPATDTWRDGPALPEPTSGAAEGLVDGVIFVSGGETSARGGEVIDRHWSLDTRLGAAASWEPLPPPPLAVHGAHGATLGGRFMIVGGASRQGSFSRFAWTTLSQSYQLPD